MRKVSAKTPYLIVLVLVLALGGAWYWFQYSRMQPEPAARMQAPVVPAVPGPREPPPVRFPVVPDTPPVPQVDSPAAQTAQEPAMETDVAPAPEPEAPARPAPLPELEASDGAVRGALAGTLDTGLLDRLFVAERWIQRFVVSVDNLTASKLPGARYLSTRPLPERFGVEGENDALAIAPGNARRYEPVVRLVESVDVAALVALYRHYYPLFQSAFDDLGYPGVYFNDRLVDVIDHLLTAPEVDGPLRLVRPHVLYQFADPDLEALSAGRKLLVRMGPDNARRIKTRLRELRTALTALDRR